VNDPSRGRPVFALTPTPGHVDLIVATELLEAARMVEAGYVVRDRTTLVSATHRVFTISEKSAMSDARYKSQRVVEGAQAIAKRAILVDMKAIMRQQRCGINAVVLGAIAASGILPIDRAVFEAAIRESGSVAEDNLRAFSSGYQAVLVPDPIDPKAFADAKLVSPRSSQQQLMVRVVHDFPSSAHELVGHGLARLCQFQGDKYANLYLDRLAAVYDCDRQHSPADYEGMLTKEVARHLALRMSYEDIIRVADLKTRSSRFRRVREEIGASPKEPVKITEFLKPGIEELCALLPDRLASFVLRKVTDRGWRDKLHVGVYVNTSSVTGFLLLWTMARMRFLRPWTSRFKHEQREIERWLDTVVQAARINYDFGLQVTECARLIKGYGSTYRRGAGNYARVMQSLVLPAIARGTPPATSISDAVAAALADPDGVTLDRVLVA
jgi:indolepyruvate ferredoxin oxidoreductase beta subunit